MAIYRKEPAKTAGGIENEAKTSEAAEKEPGNVRLGRGLRSLVNDNLPAEKKPLVVRKGLYEGPRIDTRTHTSVRQPPGVGGRVVIRTDDLPKEPLRSAKSARKGTTVLVRTERTDPPKRYKTNESIGARKRYNVSEDDRIVINPRKKK